MFMLLIKVHKASYNEISIICRVVSYLQWKYHLYHQTHGVRFHHILQKRMKIMKYFTIAQRDEIRSFENEINTEGCTPSPLM